MTTKLGRTRLFVLITLLVAAVGLVWADGNVRGRVTGADGAGLAGITVELVPISRPELPTMKAVTDEGGHYIFGLVRNSSYRVKIAHEGMRASAMDGNIELPDDDSFWAYEGPIPVGSEPPEITVTGVSKVTYDVTLVADAKGPGEWGTGAPLIGLQEIVGMIQSGDAVAAEAEITRHLAGKPDEPTLNYLHAFALLTLERVDDAEKAIDKTLASNDSFEGANLIKGKILEGKKDVAGAVKHFELEKDVAMSDQVRGDALLALAVGMVQLGEDDGAITTLEELLELRPNDVAALKELAGLYLKAGDEAKSKELLDRVSEAGGQADPAVLYNLAAERFNEKAFEDAVAYLEQCIEADANFAAAHLLLGKVRLNLGKMPEAVEALEKYLELEPEGDEADFAKQIVAALGKK